MHDLSNAESLSISESQKIRPAVRLIDHPLNVVENLRPFLSKHDIEIMDSQNNVIGKIILSKKLKSDKPDHPRPRGAWIDEIRLEQGYTGKGFGKAAYLELLKSLGDMPLISATLNDFSTPIWESLVRDGLAEKEYLESNGQQKMVGYVSLPETIKAKLIDPQT